MCPCAENQQAVPDSGSKDGEGKKEEAALLQCSPRVPLSPGSELVSSSSSGLEAHH